MRPRSAKVNSFSIICSTSSLRIHWIQPSRVRFSRISFYLLLKVHLESCPFKVVSCTNENCNETMTRNNLHAHVTITCPWRILQCCHCSVLYPACKTEVNVALYHYKIIQVGHVKKRALLGVIHFLSRWFMPQLWHERKFPQLYSYFEKGCRKKCTRQSRKALWVVLSSLFFKEIWKNSYGRP